MFQMDWSLVRGCWAGAETGYLRRVKTGSEGEDGELG
jgi:hypothetical protein